MYTEQLQDLKASGAYPRGWFAGYTKMSDDEQAAIIAKCEAQDAANADPAGDTREKATEADATVVESAPEPSEGEEAHPHPSLVIDEVEEVAPAGISIITEPFAEGEEVEEIGSQEALMALLGTPMEGSEPGPAIEVEEDPIAPPTDAWGHALAAMAAHDADGPSMLMAALEENREDFLTMFEEEPESWIGMWDRVPDDGLHIVRVLRDWIAGLPPTPSVDAVHAGMSCILNRDVPDGIPVTSHGYPVRVQVIASRTVEWKGGSAIKQFRRGTIHRGQRAWDLWEYHRSLVAPLTN